MKFRVKDMDIATGDILIVTINDKDAKLLDLHHMDRVTVKKNSKTTIAIVDIAESGKAVPVGQIGLFEEVLDALEAVDGDIVELSFAKKPVSVNYIKKKMDGKKLSYDEVYSIMKDIVDNKLTSIELTSYIIANYMQELSPSELADLTKAMINTGSQLKLKEKVVADLHCIGGIPGNRTTMIVVPILVAAGLCVPKTASRAITSPSGTADTMEVLCDVSLSLDKLKNIAESVGGFIVWGGAMRLAPADDKIIKIENPLNIDAEGQMLSSIMAKKASVSTTHLLMDIPLGAEAKVKTVKHAAHLEKHFKDLSKELGIKIILLRSDGSQPIGNGIGPVLEAKDCLWLLHNDPRGPADLKKKSLAMAGLMLEFTGKAKKGSGFAMAKKLLEDGSAYKAMLRIMRAQGCKETDPEKLRTGKYSHVVRAQKSGKVVHVSNLAIAKIARMSGAPHDPEAGIYLFKHKGDAVKKGEPLFEIFSINELTLKQAVDLLKERRSVEIK